MKKKNNKKSKDLIRLVDRTKVKEDSIIQNSKNINKVKNEENKLNKSADNKPVINLNYNYNKVKNINNNYIITVLRVRPENEEEQNYSNINVIKVESSTSVKIVSPTEYNYFIEGSKYLNNDKGLEVTKTKEYNFKFDYIFDKKSNQNEVYQISTAFLVDNIFDGFNSTIFAYGATGTGKTYTMFGTWEKPGIVIRAINQILNIMESNGLNKDYALQISYFEIYNESLYDLLAVDGKNKNVKRKIAESTSPRDNDYKYNKNNPSSNKFCLMGITKKVVKSEDEAFILLTEANKIRSKGFTSQNNNSSRSHGVVHINIINKKAKNNGDDLNNSTLIENKEKTIFGKFIMVDLAGAEKVAEVRPNSDNFYINKSIFTLNNCINGLVHDKNNNYIPWRDSKLTRILKEPLSGNSKIVMIANISPSLMVIEDTYTTLNFAKKIKMVRTYAQKNLGNEFIRIDKFDFIIQHLRDQILMIKNEIKQKEDEENSLVFNEDDNREMEYDEKNVNDILQEYIRKINAHFKKEIDVIKKINELELKISNIQNENYFNKLNNNDIKNNVNKLNDYQVEINAWYSRRHQLMGKRKVIQLLISNEMKKTLKSPDYSCIGTYLMYVYKYNINLISEIQDKNRLYKIDNDIIRKDNQIQNLSSQIKIRDNMLKYIKEKTGHPIISYNIKKYVDLETLNMDPCVDINSINYNSNLEQFVNNIVSVANKSKMKRNVSMPMLRNQVKVLNKYKTNNNTNINNSLPHIKIKTNLKGNSFNNNSSLVKKRIPSGYILQNHRTRFNNLKSNLFGYKKYYNIYHVSNNYHVGNFSAANPTYSYQKRCGSTIKKRNNSSIDFESDYASKVKTILNKNYISRFYNSPYSFENV